MSQYKDLINKYSAGKKITDEELLKIQKGLIFLLDEIVRVCDKYDLKPFLIAGNLLGKVRHNGFIPWDDDLDLGMLREDYNKFVDVFEKELSHRYVISAPFDGYKATNRFIQVGRKGTVLQSCNATSDSEDIVTNHLYIDIFPFDYVPDNAFIRRVKGIWCNLLMAIAGSVGFVEGASKESKAIFKHSFKGRIELYTRLVAGNLLSFKPFTNWAIAVNKAVERKKHSGLIGNAVGRKHFFGETVCAEDFLPLKRTEYCGIDLYQPNNPEVYLKAMYGDYMEIPPIEKRESHNAVNIFIPDEMLR